MTQKKTVSILGATGSIGQSTVDIIVSDPERFEVCTISAHENYEALAEIAQRLKARTAIIADERYEDALRDKLQGTGISVLSGEKSLEQAVQPETDLTVAAISGVAGLRPLMHASEKQQSCSDCQQRTACCSRADCYG